MRTYPCSGAGSGPGLRSGAKRPASRNGSKNRRKSGRLRRRENPCLASSSLSFILSMKARSLVVRTVMARGSPYLAFPAVPRDSTLACHPRTPRSRQAVVPNPFHRAETVRVRFHIRSDSKHPYFAEVSLRVRSSLGVCSDAPRRCRAALSSVRTRGFQVPPIHIRRTTRRDTSRSEEHTSELQSPDHLVCRLL